MDAIFEFLISYRRSAKAFKKAAALSKSFDVIESALDQVEDTLDILENNEPSMPVSKLGEIVRNAMAYAWEVGHGQPMREVLDSSLDNPFMVPDWRMAIDG